MKKWLISGLMLALLMGCSAVKLGYNNADLLLEWQIDKYFDLDSEQETFVEERLDYHLKWHRDTQMPRYSAFTEELAAKLSDGLSSEEYDWFFAEVQSAYRDLVERIAPDAATLLRGLSDEQIRHYREKLEERNEERREWVQRSDEEHLERRVERTVERMEEWLGSVSPAQRIYLKRGLSEIPRTTKYWVDHSLNRQQAFIDLLQSKPPHDIFVSRLKSWFIDWEQGQSPEYAKIDERHDAMAKQLALDIDQMLSNEQRQYAVERIRNYHVDFRELAARE